MKNTTAIITALVLIIGSLTFRTYSAEKEIKTLNMLNEVEAILESYSKS